MEQKGADPNKLFLVIIKMDLYLKKMLLFSYGKRKFLKLHKYQWNCYFMDKSVKFTSKAQNKVTHQTMVEM